MSNLSSSSSITPTPSTFHNTPTATHPNSVYVHSGAGAPSDAGLPPPSPNRSRIPVTPAALRSIFASSRTALEERSLSRVAFFRFTGFLLSCLAISLAAARGRALKSGAALLGVGVV
ncbi:hypothetical protein K466DRAFT_483981 [Polyporus arcularius HHB13444]|uniref:Uncharacterized protein n=2 Tax=Polyporaceae TaxID=5317 RepID=A0A5C3PXM9_9APHY|nr:hypothetical protein OH76DRAFT_1342793 [Polyporus brumalis]TFK90853.1 hypothetical protein K466DRAFT_483981 [Polyporus arcularius HHB13444]